MDTKTIGECSEAQVLAAFLKARLVVLYPFGDNQRYDFVLDQRGKFIRIQVKTARLNAEKGVITFCTCSSSTHRGGKKRGYSGQIEYFAAYCVENQKIYLVPEPMAPRTSMSLRLGPPSKYNATDVHNGAETFEFTEAYQFTNL